MDYQNKTLLSRQSRKIILVTLQWDLERDQDYRQTGLSIELLYFIKEFGQAFDWWLRIHPVMLQDNRRGVIYSTMEDEFVDHENVFWEHCTDLPLPVVLAQTDLHLTLNSAVTIEAGWFGIKTALLGSNTTQLKEWFAEELKSGIAEIVPAEKKFIYGWINQNITKKCHSYLSMDNELLNKFIDDIRFFVSAGYDGSYDSDSMEFSRRIFVEHCD
jgi:hypothetical protein